jgi:hypothetical protein
MRCSRDREQTEQDKDQGRPHYLSGVQVRYVVYKTKEFNQNNPNTNTCFIALDMA